MAPGRQIMEKISSLHISPGREASDKAILARSLMKHYLITDMEGLGIGTIEWQLRAEADTYVAAHGSF
jgi:hypothetical protein